MKAWVYDSYGSPDGLRLADVPVPTPRDDDVLIKVHAVSLNGSDSEGLRGYPGYTRIGGLFRPRRKTLGSDIAGTVVAVGDRVTWFKPGDAVFGDNLERMGGLAEFALAPEKVLLAKPDGLSFEDAAALPQGAVIALQGMRKAGVRPGMAVLVNGAGGSAGTYALLFAKLQGAEVTAVDNAGKQDFLRSLGADHVIDYAREDFTRAGQRYDVIFDVFVRRSAADYRRALKPRGSYFFVGGPVRRMLSFLAASPFMRLATGKRIRLLIVMPSLRDLAAVAEMCAAGTLRPPIGQVVAFGDVQEAFRALVAGKALGKVVVRVG